MSKTFALLIASSLCLLVLSQQMLDEDMSADKRMRQFAFAKRSPYRAFAFAKRDGADVGSDDSEDVDMEKRARFAFAKRAYRQFAFAKRASPYGFAFAKRMSSFA